MTHVWTRCWRGFPSDCGEWWVDDEGIFIPADDIESSFDRIGFRHYGLVRITISRFDVKLQWDVQTVQEPVLWSVVDRLREGRRDVGWTLRYCFFGWAHEHHASARTALDRVCQIQKFREVRPIHSTVFERHSIDEIESASPLVQQAWRFWHRSDGRFERAREEELSAHLPHVLIIRPDRHEDNLVFSWIGTRSECSRIYGREWAASTIGRALEKSTEPERQNYTSAVNAGIAETMETGEPRYEHIRTLVRLDDADPTWCPYQRLVCRHRLHDGRLGVLVLTTETQDITVPLVAAP